MWYVGLDVHSRQSSYCVLDQGGEVLHEKTVRGPVSKVLAELAAVKQVFTIVYEASCNYGYLYDELSKIAWRVVVAHPAHLRLIFRSKRKNDRIDAQKLAKMLILDMVPTVHVPSRGVRAWRGMIEHRARQVDERTRLKNGLRALLRGRGIESPKSLWSRAGLAWLRAVVLSEPLDAIRRDDLVSRLELANASVRRVEAELDRTGRNHPAVVLLRTIPGVGIRTAEALVAYIDQPDRFRRTKAIGNYFGLVPCQDASAGKNHFGHITHDGPATVRRLLTQAAWQGIRRSAVIRAYFERVQHGDPDRKKIALVATMHYLARVSLAMLRTGEAWRAEEPEGQAETENPEKNQKPRTLLPPVA
jgi:transposase